MQKDIARPAVGEAREGDRVLLAEVLVDAFQRDPFAQWLYRDPKRRREAHGRFFNRVLTGLPRGAIVDATANLDAVAIWQPMGSPHRSSLDLALEPDLTLGEEANRLFAIIDAASPDTARWKLMFIGARTAGTGAGTSLLSYRLPLIAGPVALWTGNESNIAFYNKSGFDVVSRHDAEGASAWWLVRGGEPEFLRNRSC